jgi:hypothetical protein
MRLYLAIGRAKLFSIKGSQLLYVGLNSRDSNLRLHEEISNKLKEKLLVGLLNEYWLGELLTQWAADDTQTSGLTRYTEKALIYALDPLENLTGQETPPPFSFRVVNIPYLRNRHRPLVRLFRNCFPTRFQSLVPCYVEYDEHEGLLLHGTLKLKARKQVSTRMLDRKSQEAKRRSYEPWWTQRFVSHRPSKVTRKQS